MASKISTAGGTPAKPATTQAAKPLLAADRIRKTAREMFYRDGIRAVGVDAIVTQAGVTKPSLYRSFSSKDELAATYLRDYDAEFWARFDGACAAHPGDPRAQLLDYLSGLSKRAVLNGYRGCGLTNAAVEYPEPDHPARVVAVAHKLELRRRLNAMTLEMGATDPEALADGLLLLIEGAFVSSQLFGEGGPAGRVAEMADKLIQIHLPG
ncbi:TetR/AcrR family transcriptional regulator [Achromobacter seleniivolatilans]|uniref:TetR/AcrR family transcriptional regulator n=1 Tax=Achromobacter seleniivolatilans TaxID=3047478 RepID=A0ABY9M2R7_9BURK|nr:TetR/AcrR family transcriptional regulator [Achromobacter sp. R39]WMD21323.1 TetR/AcrR family transcriptional regulator [Achromobacter sp. R39]